MTALAILTPSYRPDFEGFDRLHRSVLRHTGQDVMHHVIVPGLDAGLYRSIDSPRLRVWTYQDVIPRGLIATDRTAARMSRVPGLPSSLNCAALSWRRPWKPVRGWVLQQIVKMGMAHHLDDEVFVNIDSDVVLVRPLRAESFVRDGAVRLYTDEDAVSPSMKRHYRWARAAHELLGLPWQDRGSYPDHVAGVVSWDSRLLRECLARVERVAGQPWAAAVAAHLHFSEDILYGTYVRHFGSERDRSHQRDTTRCHSHWSPTPMGPAEAEQFITGFGEEHLAVHIQSTSATDDAITEHILDRLSGPARR